MRRKSIFPKFLGRPLIDRILDWPNPRGFKKGVHFVCLNRYVQVDQTHLVNPKFGQSGSYEFLFVRRVTTKRK